MLTENILATNHQIGVKGGDWVKYEVVESTASIDIDWLRIEVEGVDAQEKIVVFYLTGHYSNCSERSDRFCFNLATGRFIPEENYTIIVAFIFANLKVGDVIYESWPQYTIQSEITKTYCGAKRQVLHFHLDEYYDSTDPGHVIVNAYWDKATGFLLEYELTQDSSFFKMTAIETNLWSADLFPWFDWQTSIVILIIVICVATVIIYIFHAQRKKKLLTREHPVVEEVYCRYCGAPMHINNNFCPYCGLRAEGKHPTAEEEKYKLYLQKLEEKHKSGEISEEVYQKLKNEYLEKIRKTK